MEATYGPRQISSEECRGVIPVDQYHGTWGSSPTRALEFAVHLDSNLGGDAHQTLGLVQHCGGECTDWEWAAR